ncbi:MAG: hypothetical protein ABL940_10955 [Bacteroidia bacterium]|jgi:hypothetical protein
MDTTNNNTTPVNTLVTPTLWQRIKKQTLRYTLILVALVTLVMSYFVFTPYSEGMRAGTLVKLSKKGYLFKTWEGELSQTMFVGDQSAASSTSKLWEFSVNGNNEALVNQLNEALLSGRRIKLNYEEKYLVFSWQGDTKYFITSAEVSK